MPKPPDKTCPECGEVLAENSPYELCHVCLMKQALHSQTLAGEDTGPEVPPPPSPEEIAHHFPQFEIIACLGRGGMGVVYKARQKSLNRMVAIKILAPEKERDTAFTDRFAREAEILARLNHPHIVTIYDFGVTDGLCFLVMEFIDGVNLRDVLRDGKLDPEQALAIVPPVCDALQLAHRKGIIHRDIKPENLLLDRDGNVKIADFGVASLIYEQGSGGTPRYMAPEQRRTRATIDHRADIYALGVVLYEMLTGELPAGNLVKPSIKARIDVRIDSVVLKALERQPEMRYRSAGDFKTAVMTVDDSARREKNPGTSIIKTKWLVASVVGFLTLLALAVSLGIYLSGDDRAPSAVPGISTAEAGTAERPQPGPVTTAVEPRAVSREAREALKALAVVRMRKDLGAYDREKLGKIERLYQIANTNWRTDRVKARLAMENLVDRYKKANRTGCALLYLGQLSDGLERENYLETAIADFSDCFYGNGVQVGGFARYLRIYDLREQGKADEAAKLETELRENYPKAISHNGLLLTDLLDNLPGNGSGTPSTQTKNTKP